VGLTSKLGVIALCDAVGAAHQGPVDLLAQARGLLSMTLGEIRREFVAEQGVGHVDNPSSGRSPGGQSNGRGLGVVGENEVKRLPAPTRTPSGAQPGAQ